MTDKDDLTRRFLTCWRIVDGPELEREYRFAPPRRFRFDFVHRETMVAIELEGGVWQGGRHTSPIGYTKDCIKYNLGTLHGYRIFRLTRQMLDDDPVGHLEPIRDLMCP